MQAHAQHNTYNSDYYLAREGWLDWRIERDHLITLAHPAPGARILDVGAGGGGLSAALAARGTQPFGVETERAAVDISRARLPGASMVLISEASPTLPFAGGIFDGLAAQHVIEHFPDHAAVLAEWRRVLKPGGRVAIATPNARYPDPAHFDDPHHTHIFTQEELAALFIELGFVVEQVYTLFPYLPRFPGRGRVAAWLSGVCRRLPYFAARGRTLMLGARRQ